MGNFIEKIKQQLEESASLKRKVALEQSEVIAKIGERMADCIIRGGKILFCGNGGSAADSQHLSCELVVKLYKKERKALPAIALTTNTSTLTAEANDHGFETVFSRQVEALGEERDILVGISTSGNSVNIIRAIEVAKKLDLRTIGFLGGDGGKLLKISELNLIVPSFDTRRIQEVHIAVGHIVCELVEQIVMGG